MIIDIVLQTHHFPRKLEQYWFLSLVSNGRDFVRKNLRQPKSFQAKASWLRVGFLGLYQIESDKDFDRLNDEGCFSLFLKFDATEVIMKHLY